MKRIARSSLFAAGLLVLVVSVGHMLAGCTRSVPYRDAGLKPDPDCDIIYTLYKVAASDPFGGSDPKDDKSGPITPEHKCYRRSIEEHPTFDLLVAEMTDQGWIQASSELNRPSRDYLDEFIGKLEERHQYWGKQGRALSLVVFVHGWQNNAKPDNENVIEFRRLLDSVAWLESFVSTESKGRPPRRVVGIYVGWRGKSIDVDGVNAVTFWERKTTAERVAQGTVRELLTRLDLFRDSSRAGDGSRDVRMLTIGHSFGGLITYSSLGGEFVRNAIRFKERRGDRSDRFMSRVGDLVVLVNPAFEGARYEPLHVAGQRLCGVEPDQLPVLVVATSESDWATSYMFPAARWASTFLEDRVGYETDAIVKAVGHNPRYTTHELALCRPDDPDCRNARCKIEPAASPSHSTQVDLDTIGAEYVYMQRIVKDGFGKREQLCGGMTLTATPQWYPKDNPYWVVRTSKDVIDGHSDLFNPNFVAFIRQLYLSVIYARDAVPEKAQERNPCKRPTDFRP